MGGLSENQGDTVTKRFRVEGVDRLYCLQELVLDKGLDIDRHGLHEDDERPHLFGREGMDSKGRMERGVSVPRSAQA